MHAASLGTVGWSLVAISGARLHHPCRGLGSAGGVLQWGKVADAPRFDEPGASVVVRREAPPHFLATPAVFDVLEVIAALHESVL
jgi:hypothetical protein